MLVEVDAVELVLVEIVVLKVDSAVLLVEPRLEETEVLIASEELTIIELNDVVCVCALARNPGNENRRERKAMVMRMYELIFLPKPATLTQFNRNLAPSHPRLSFSNYGA